MTLRMIYAYVNHCCCIQSDSQLFTSDGTPGVLGNLGHDHLFIGNFDQNQIREQGRKSEISLDQWNMLHLSLGGGGGGGGSS